MPCQLAAHERPGVESAARLCSFASPARRVLDDEFYLKFEAYYPYDFSQLILMIDRLQNPQLMLQVGVAAM